MEHTLTLSPLCGSTPKFALKIVVTAALAAAVLMLAGCGGSSSSDTSRPPADLLGTWGGGTSEAPAVLTVTPTGGTLALVCGSADVLTQPLTADATGNFDVVATEIPGLPEAGPFPSIHLVGTVSGSTITLHEVFASGPGPAYTVTYGKSAPTFSGACPA